MLQQKAYILFYFKQGTEWLQDSTTKISKNMPIESPNFVLDDFNDNDNTDSLREKESPREMYDIQNGHDSLGAAYDRQNNPKEEKIMVTLDFTSETTKSLKQENMCKANALLSGVMDMLGKLENPIICGEKEVARIPFVPTSSLAAEGPFFASCSHLSGKEKASTEPVVGFQEMQ